MRPRGGRETNITAIAKLERVRTQQIAEERRRRGQWYWLSFASPCGFLGGAIVWARDVETAVLRARELKISDGFRGDVDVFCEPVSARVMKAHIPADLRTEYFRKPRSWSACAGSGCEGAGG